MKKDTSAHSLTYAVRMNVQQKNDTYTCGHTYGFTHTRMCTQTCAHTHRTITHIFLNTIVLGRHKSKREKQNTDARITN